MEHGHRFGGGGRFIEQRCVGDFHAGQIADHGLEIEQTFEAALRHLGLIRRVGRVPAGIFEHVAQDDAGRDAIGIAEAEIRFEKLIARGERAQVAQEFVFALAWRHFERLGKDESAGGSLLR